ncbi:hypothetical protein EJF36_20545 [Bacillus sp. HMF5848]|uniref:hypothetical protein n=1 Tax=Bacillus sp. HMF5848 TaxID=2495421 RepID=UPI000F7790BD|nr:hypothetical protein [Bacillus sp. HMF5848]RSK29078.1 hypothetical protein EJF36_20545 [Bacillus sp. HMF5848]
METDNLNEFLEKNDWLSLIEHKQTAPEIAHAIIMLDIVRDQMWEQLLSHAGHRAFDILRYYQNNVQR